MKPTKIRCGRVYQAVQGKGQWTYSIEYVYPAGAQMVSAGINFVEKTQADSAMHDEVKRLTARYGRPS